MAIPAHRMAEATEILDEFCKNLIPEHAYGKVHVGYAIKGSAITLHQSYPRFDDKSKWIDHSVARIRYTMRHDTWTLYYQDGNLIWRRYELIDPKKRFRTIMEEIKKDPTCIFWG